MGTQPADPLRMLSPSPSWDPDSGGGQSWLTACWRVHRQWKQPQNPWGDIPRRDTGCPQLRFAGQQPKAGGIQIRESAVNSLVWGKLRHGSQWQEGLGRVELPSSHWKMGFLTAVACRHPPATTRRTLRTSAWHQAPPSPPLPPVRPEIGDAVLFEGKPKI